MVKVLLVVSDRIEMTLMRYALENNGCEVEVVTNGFSALKILDEEMKYDLLVTSEELPVMKGADLCRAVKKSKAGIKVIGMDIDSESEMPREAESLPSREAEYDYFIGGAFKIQKVADALDFVLERSTAPTGIRRDAPNVRG